MKQEGLTALLKIQHCCSPAYNSLGCWLFISWSTAWDTDVLIVCAFWLQWHSFYYMIFTFIPLTKFAAFLGSVTVGSILTQMYTFLFSNVHLKSFKNSNFPFWTWCNKIVVTYYCCLLFCLCELYQFGIFSLLKISDDYANPPARPAVYQL